MLSYVKDIEALFMAVTKFGSKYPFNPPKTSPEKNSEKSMKIVIFLKKMPD